MAERLRFDDLDVSKSYIVVTIVEGTQFISAPFPISADLTHINAIDEESRLLPEFYLFQQD